MDCFLLKAITKVLTVSLLVIVLGSLHVFLGSYFGRRSSPHTAPPPEDPQVRQIRELVHIQTQFLNSVSCPV